MGKETLIEVESNVHIYVKESGQGDPVVFIPGFTFTTEVFEKQVEYFSKTNRVIVIDPRSHGKSTMTTSGNDYVTHGTDLHYVLEKLALENVTLVGWSFGCLTVWEYFKQCGSEKIKNVILIDMPPKSLSINEKHDWVEGSLDDLAAIYHANLRTVEGQKAFITSYSTNVMVQRNLSENELNWLVNQSLQTPPYIAASLFASGLFSDYRTEATKLNESVPTLTFVAEHWVDIAKPYMNQITPKAKIEVLGGHMMFWEHAEKFNDIVSAFLK